MADIRPLLALKLLLVTGKGGVGKTLVTATLGQALAAEGRGALLVESAATDQIAPLFGKAPGPKHEEAVLGERLGAINLDPPENFREYVVKYLNQPFLYEKVFNHRVVKSFINTIPGFSELMMLGRLFYAVELKPSPRYPTVVYDGFASGHFLSLMTTPDAVLQSSLGGPVAKESERIKAFLGDTTKCGIVYVATPEELVVSEALDFLPKLREKAPAKLAAIVVNRVPPVPAPGSDAASQFTAARRARAEQALVTLTRGLERLRAEHGLDVPVYLLPELGSVDEPFAPDFGTRLWADAAEGLK